MPIIQCRKCGSKNRVDIQRAKSSQPRCGKCGAPLDINGEASSSTQKPLMVTDATFQQTLSEAGSRPLLLDCWAEWCGPCRMIAPVMDQLAAESSGRYVIAKLNVDENPVTANRFSIRSIPSLLIFKNGQLIDRLVGAHPKQDIVAHLARAA